MPAAEGILYGPGSERQSARGLRPHSSAKPQAARPLDTGRAPAYTGRRGPIRLPGSQPGVQRYGGAFVSIIRVGLAETKHFAEGYEAIFGKKKDKKDEKGQSGAKAETGKKRKPGKKKK